MEEDLETEAAHGDEGMTLEDEERDASDDGGEASGVDEQEEEGVGEEDDGEFIEGLSLGSDDTGSTAGGEEEGGAMDVDPFAPSDDPDVHLEEKPLPASEPSAPRSNRASPKRRRQVKGLLAEYLTSSPQVSPIWRWKGQVLQRSSTPPWPRQESMGLKGAHGMCTPVSVSVSPGG